MKEEGEEGQQYQLPQPLPPLPVNLTVTLPPNSVMMPSWLVFCFVGAFVLSTFVLFLVWTTNRTLSFEVRALQLYEQDIENVLIRHGLATREDFAPHPNSIPISDSHKGGNKK